jgi:demethoxyubiquinone hydroxylase (CLK1/Coq7/Cat5 family)
MNVIEYEDARQLNSFLRGELSAVKTYEQCMERVKNPQIVHQLRLLQTSHNRRVRLLRQRIEQLGGKPAEDASIWGSVTQAIAGGAGLFGPKVALKVLEEGEAHGLADYQRDTKKLSPLQRTFVEVEVLPEQRRSYEVLDGIERAFSPEEP